MYIVLSKDICNNLHIVQSTGGTSAGNGNGYLLSRKGRRSGKLQWSPRYGYHRSNIVGIYSYINFFLFSLGKNQSSDNTTFGQEVTDRHFFTDVKLVN